MLEDSFTYAYGLGLFVIFKKLYERMIFYLSFYVNYTSLFIIYFPYVLLLKILYFRFKGIILLFNSCLYGVNNGSLDFGNNKFIIRSLEYV
jgi:hypothetical protein